MYALKIAGLVLAAIAGVVPAVLFAFRSAEGMYAVIVFAAGVAWAMFVIIAIRKVVRRKKGFRRCLPGDYF